MPKKKSAPKKRPAQNEPTASVARQKILKARFSAAELRKIRFAAVIVDQSNATFLRVAALEKADAVARDPQRLQQFMDDCDPGGTKPNTA
jgi:hypothetical protein